MGRPRTNTSCAFLVRPASRKESAQEQIVKERTQEAFKSSRHLFAMQMEEEARLESVFWIRSSKTRQRIGVYQNMEAA